MLTVCWIQNESERKTACTLSAKLTTANQVGVLYIHPQTIPNLKSNKLHSKQKLSRLTFRASKLPVYMFGGNSSAQLDGREGGCHYSNATFSCLSLIPFLARCHSKTECNQFPRANWRAINCARAALSPLAHTERRGSRGPREMQVRHYSIPSQ